MKIKLLVVIYLLLILVSSLRAQTLGAPSVDGFFQQLEGNWGLLSGSSMELRHDGTMGETWTIDELRLKALKGARFWQLQEGSCQSDSKDTQVCADSFAQYSVKNELLFFVDPTGKELPVSLVRVTPSLLSFRIELGSFAQEVTWELTPQNVLLRTVINRLNGKFVTVTLSALKKGSM